MAFTLAEGIDVNGLYIGAKETLRSSCILMSGGVVVLLKLCGSQDFVEFVLGRFSHFTFAIAYSNFTWHLNKFL